jgi:hypothetical protein
MPEKRKSAFIRATQEAQATAPTVSPTRAPLHRAPVEQQEPKAVQKEKVSFYLEPTQTRKLDDLAYQHLTKTGRRINRNDIVRHLIEQCEQSTLADL